MSNVPATIGRYRVVNRIGKSRVGILYLAFDPSLERQVAIKILLDDNDDLRQRFSREARSAARLRHPNIVTVYDVGEDEGHPFMAMEYIEGSTLAGLIAKQEPMTVVRKLELAEALTDGLAFAHKAGVIHRDVEPGNIMIDVAGALKILDFGLARVGDAAMTRAGLPVGSLHYMSPEQLTGATVDQRSDIFSVGSVCYELFSYRQAFPGGLGTGMLQRLRHGETEPLGIVCAGLDPEIVTIVHRCLQADVQKRYQDLGTMMKDLSRVRRRLSPSLSQTIAVTPREAPTIVRPAQDAPTIVVTSRSARRSIDPGDIARRRATEIQTHLQTAWQAFNAKNYEQAISECEGALVIDPENAQAIELLDRAKAAEEERRANRLLSDAESDVARGALTSALSKTEKAVAIVPASTRAADLRRVVDEALRQQELAKQRAEKIRALVASGLGHVEQGRFAEAIAAADEVLALAPGHVEARALKTRANDAAAAKAREELERRARECLREARRLMDAGGHDAALDLLARFEPKHDIVTRGHEDLKAEIARIERQRKLEADQQAKRGRIDAGLARARGHVERQEFADALDALYGLADAEGESAEIAALIESTETELTAAETRQRELAEAVAVASGLFMRRDFAGALARTDTALTLDAHCEPAKQLGSKIQEAVRAATAQNEARSRRTRERQHAVAAALEEARSAASDEGQISAIAKAFEIEPEDPGVRTLLADRAARIDREEAERRRTVDADRRRKAEIEQMLGAARQSLRDANAAAAIRMVGRIRKIDPDNLESECLATEIAALYDVSEIPPEPEPVVEAPVPTSAAVPNRAAASASLEYREAQYRAAPARPTPAPKPQPEELFGLPPIVVYGAAALIVVLLLIAYFVFAR